MSCCPPPDCYPDICPRPCIDVRNEPCISSCGDSTAVVFAPPVVVRFPGPTLATCPQDSFVGTALPNLPFRAGGSGSVGGYGGSTSYGGSSRGGYGGSYGGYGGGNSIAYGGGAGGGYGGGAGGGYGGGAGGGYGGVCGGSYGAGGSYGYSRKSYRSISGGGSSGSGYGNCGPC